MEDRRKEDKRLAEIHTILCDPDIGLAKLVKKHNEAIYGNGFPGLKTQVALLGGAVTLLGSFVIYYLKCALPAHLR